MKKEKRRQILMKSPNLLWNLLVRGSYELNYDLMPAHISQMSMKKRFNLLKAGVNLFYRNLTPWNLPFNMQIELTNFCNLKCPVCPVGTKELNRRPMAMSIGLFERLMEEVGSYLLTAALFAWGEPLLHPKLPDILRIANKHRIVIRLSTNGQNLNDDKIIDTLITHPPTYLIVAIDGLTDETNSKYRVGAKLEKILSGVYRLAEIKQKKGLKLPILHMRYIVMKHNQHELMNVRSFAENNRFEFLTIRTLSTIDSSEDTHRMLIPDTERYRAFNYKYDKRIQRNDFICDMPFVFPTILADGTLVACDQDYNAKQPLGILTDGVSFKDIWFGKQAVKTRKIVRDSRKSLSFCRNCPYADRQDNTCSIQAFYLKEPYIIPTV